MKYTIPLLALLIVLTACGGGGSQSAPQPVTGTVGLLIEPVRNAPDVYAGEEFDVLFDMHNQGAHNITDGILTVSYDPQYLEFTQFTASKPTVPEQTGYRFDLQGANPFFRGEQTFLHAGFRALPIERFSGFVNTRIAINACYPYKTHVSTQVCIEQDRLRDAGEVVCTNNRVRPGSTGAPVVVEDVEVRSQTLQEGDELRPSVTFRITLRNRDSGIVSSEACLRERCTKMFDTGDNPFLQFLSNFAQTCIPQSADGLNQVNIRGWLLDHELECSPAQPRFVRGEAWTICRTQDDIELRAGGGNYLSLLQLEVDYSYRDTVTQEVRIER